MAKIKVQRSDEPEQPWYATIVADNGEVLFTSETYHNKSDVFKATQRVMDDRLVLEVDE